MKSKISPILLLLVAGCSNPHLDLNRGVETVKVPVVETSKMTYDLRLGSGSTLPAGQARALDEYLGSIGIAYGDRISVDDPSPVGAAERRQAIAEVVARYGLLLDGTTPVTTGSVPPGTVRVVVTRARATVPGCPDWSRSSAYEPDAAVSSNYGCAVRGNLAEMIADPNDLIVGKSYSGSDGFTASSAIDRRRAGPAPAASMGAGPSIGSNGAARGN